jgi:peptidyl-prolyl cis-trans isomerase SurA
MINLNNSKYFGNQKSKITLSIKRFNQREQQEWYKLFLDILRNRFKIFYNSLKMRKDMTANRIKLVTLLSLLSFIFILPIKSYATVLLDRVVALVNKEVITWSELYKTMEYEASDQVKSMNDKERLKIFKDSEAAFLEKLIDMRLQVQEAKQLGLEVTPGEVEEAIESIKKKYSMTDNALEESLKKEGLTFEEYKKRLADQILISKYVNQQIRNKIIVSEEEVEKYMDSNKENLQDSEAFKLRQIFFMRPKDDTDKKAIEEKASLIIQRLKSGEDFSSLAEEYSEDPSSKLGGDLGFIKKNYMAKEFIDELNTMKVGDFSNPFWTEKGLHIIKLDEKISAKNRDEVREEVRKQLTEEIVLEKYKSWIKDLREKAYIVIRL